MTFQKVLRIPKGILRGTGDIRFLHKLDLEKLGEHDLLFFLRTNNYHILDDYPCMGAFERRLDSSRTEGPFESTPETEQQKGRGYSESEKYVLEMLIPSDIMPVTFQAVTYVSHETAVDENSQRHLRLVARDRIDPDKIWEVGNRILGNLQKKPAKIEQQSESRYTTTIDDCLVEFGLAKTHFYPLVEMAIFGKGETPLQLMRELGVYEIGEQFLDYDRDVGIRDSTMRGLSYNVSLNGKSISDMLKSENLVI